MNSLSNCNNNGNCFDHCKPEHECFDHCKPEHKCFDHCEEHHHRHCFNPCPPKFVECPENVDLHPLPGSALLEKGIGNNPVINQASILGLPPSTTNPIVIAQVTIDPTCLCFPTIKIEFSSLLKPADLFDRSSLTIQLNRLISNCNTTPVKEILETFTMDLSGLTHTLPFSFVFGDVCSSSKPRTYSVEITAASNIADDSSIQLSNANILALADGGLREC